MLRERAARVIGVSFNDTADVVADLSTPEGRATMVKDVTALAGGSIDGVIACAGGGQTTRGSIVSVNFFGAVATLDGLRPLLARGTHPRAVAVLSTAMLWERSGDPVTDEYSVDDRVVEACLDGDEEAANTLADPRSAYSSAKRALARWIRRVAPTEPWAGAGIPVNGVAPGSLRTARNEAGRSTDEGRALFNRLVPMPLCGPGEPDHIASLLAWFTSPDNALVTGQVVFADAGADVVLRGEDIW
jgi:NAD(P)-dependent dehydrogenase (short-subunit alcohol dehydrogenase family)